VVTFWDEELGKLLVKRVIGLSGDEVSLSGGYVYVNGQRLEEPYLDQQGATDPAGSGQADFQVPEGCLFLLGDNRTGSLDSRYWSNPYIAYNNVRARVFLCIPIQFWHKIPLPQVGDISLIH
jgi:signal peptidase I